MNTLELPAPLEVSGDGATFRDTGERSFVSNPGGTCNYYHRLFLRAAASGRPGWSPFNDFQAVRSHARVSIRVTHGLHARNHFVAQADHCLAMTFGDGRQLKDGGTAHTMGLFLSRPERGQSFHLDLHTLRLHPGALVANGD